MRHTIYRHLLDDELLTVVACRDSATDLEVELALRVERLAEEVEALNAPRPTTGGTSCPRPKAR